MISSTSVSRRIVGSTTFAPLATPAFRNIWLASLISNVGALVQGVGAAWIMADITTPSMVAMVQTATFLPLTFFALPAGALADMYDRRRIQMTAVCIAMSGAALLTALALAQAVTPWSLLAMCFFVGSGMALFSPAWQSSPAEQVPPAVIPSAVALNGISYNVARSFGPAVGGVIVAVAGVPAAFAANVLCYIPMLLALKMWARQPAPARLPPENLGRAMMSGLRYILHMRPVRTAIVRSLATGLLGAALLSLMPLVARDLVSSGAAGYGLMLGFFGAGAVAAIFVLQRARRIGNERLVAACSVTLGVCVAAIGVSRSLPLTASLLLFAGAAWMIQVSTVSIAVQLFVPRWVAGRVIATLNATVAGGIACGAVIWGRLAEEHGTQTALFIAASLLVAAPVLGRILPIADREREARGLDVPLADPEVAIGIDGRSGPIVIELSYQVPTGNAREFYDLMRHIRRVRIRNGAFDWTISRSLTDADHWIERFRTPTWDDYLRQRSRCTEEEMRLQRSVHNFLSEGSIISIERRLERPFGSVRWRANSPVGTKVLNA